MKSLNKVKDISELKKWYMSLGLKGNAGVICMPKLDGLSLLYNELTGEAYSRGGIENEGQDCTSHYRASIQCYNPASSFHYTFGEFVINRSDWEQHFHGKRSKFTGDIFKSPRNTAAGLLNRDEPCDYLEHASFFRYGVDESSLHDYNNFHSLIETICNIYQQEHLYHFAFIDELNEELLMNLFKEWSKVYPIDGIVIYIDDLHLWEVIGRHQTSGNPLYAIAYKHPDFTESFETTVKGIVWKVSKSGALKPVVNIEMVDTGDCNMENPTGYNAGWINDHEIAKGAEILVTRSGGVIPKILSTLSPATQEEQEKLWDEMSECPHCGSSTMWNENHIELCCTNPSCPGVQLAKIIFFYLTCGAENMGEETLSKIFNAGFTSIPAILNVTFNDLIKIEGFGDSISNIILENNRKIMQGVDLATLMQASDCFKGIGKIKARIVAKMNSLCDRGIIAALYAASAAGVKIDLIVRGICCLKVGIPGISENITVRSIVGNFLEHSRIFYFYSDGNEEVFMGSADWMPRNLDKRVEIVFPVEDEQLKEEVKHILEIQLEDNVKAHILQPDGTYEKVDKRGKMLLNSQDFFCEEATRRAKIKLPETAADKRIFVPAEAPEE